MTEAYLGRPARPARPGTPGAAGRRRRPGAGWPAKRPMNVRARRMTSSGRAGLLSRVLRARASASASPGLAATERPSARRRGGGRGPPRHRRAPAPASNAVLASAARPSSSQPGRARRAGGPGRPERDGASIGGDGQRTLVHLFVPAGKRALGLPAAKRVDPAQPEVRVGAHVRIGSHAFEGAHRRGGAQNAPFELAGATSAARVVRPPRQTLFMTRRASDDVLSSRGAQAPSHGANGDFSATSLAADARRHRHDGAPRPRRRTGGGPSSAFGARGKASSLLSTMALMCGSISSSVIWPGW